MAANSSVCQRLRIDHRACVPGYETRSMPTYSTMPPPFRTEREGSHV